MKQLEDWIDKLRAMPEEQARRAARATGTEDLLPMRNLNPEDYDRLKYASEFEAERNNKEQTDKAMHRIAQDVADSRINPTPWQNMGRDANYDWRQGDPHPILPRNEQGERLPDFDTWRRQQQQQERGNGQENTQQRATTAMERHAQALEEFSGLLRSGRFGGGERAAGAVPAAFMGAGWAVKQKEREAHSMGAFSL